MTRFPGAHRWQNSSGCPERTQQICVEQLAGVCFVHLFECTCEAISSIVDQHIDPPKMVKSALNRVGRFGSIRYVELDWEDTLAVLRFQICDAFQIADGCYDAISTIKGCLCPSFPKAAGGAGDKPNFQFTHRSAFPSFRLKSKGITATPTNATFLQM
jgi:hypothetical protein